MHCSKPLIQFQMGFTKLHVHSYQLLFGPPSMNCVKGFLLTTPPKNTKVDLRLQKQLQKMSKDFINYNSKESYVICKKFGPQIALSLTPMISLAYLLKMILLYLVAFIILSCFIHFMMVVMYVII